MTPTLGAIIASGFASVLIAFIWFHPKLFGTAWQRMMEMTPDQMEKGKKRMPLVVFFAFVASMLVAYVMSYVSAAWGFYEWQGALQLGFWIWLGFVAPILLGSVLWDQKPFSLYLINALYWLVALLVMAQIIVFAYNLEYSMYLTDGADVGAYEFE